LHQNPLFSKSLTSKREDFEKFLLNLDEVRLCALQE